MSDTAPYATFETPADTRRRAHAAAIDGPFQLVLAGTLTIGADNDARVLRILDHHPELARLVTLTMGNLEVTRPTTTLDFDGWLKLRRGLLLCASQAATGEITVRNPGLWAFHATASEAQPRWSRSHTDDFAKTTRVRRPARRGRREPPEPDGQSRS